MERGFAPGAAFPATPSTKRNPAVEAVINQLNTDYNLGIELPDPTLSPARRDTLAQQDEQYKRWVRICGGIKFLYWRRDDSLKRALEDFLHEAKVASLHWVPKPRADPTTLPAAQGPGVIPPKAQTARQQWTLQGILIDVLDSFKGQTTPQQPALSIAKHKTAVVPVSSDESDVSSLSGSPSSTASKRSRSFYSEAGQGAGKRRKPKKPPAPRAPSPASTFADALDNVPTRQRLDRGRQPPSRSSSSGTSHSNSSSLFSHGDGQQSTQTTLDDEPRDVKRSAGLVVPKPNFSVAQHSPSRASLASTIYSDFPNISQNSFSEALAAGQLETTSDDDGIPFNPELHARLQNIWPKFPRWLHEAPPAIAWELTRICLHCKVSLDEPTLQYNPKWATSDLPGIWASLHQLDVFRGKSFPVRPSADAFAAALTGGFESRGNTVVMSATLEFNPGKTGPLFLLDMKPLRFDQGCRLTRRFGPDRFLEVLVPSPTAMNGPAILKDGGSSQVIRWLTQAPHSLVGRQWQAFYSKDAGYRKPIKEFRLGPDAKSTFKERVHFFAETGHNFVESGHNFGRPDGSFHGQPPTKIRVSEMLDWLLQLKRNEHQPHLKLFSRIQLGLSKTTPTVTFHAGQIIHHDVDILSPTGKVMNDGIGRMSRTVARKIRDTLGLSDIPSAIQGRIGSAKGMWLMDVDDTGDHDWIETYPSQRKWKCDDDDPFHRTLEVREVSSELRPAALNLQFLPVLEDRAKDKKRMRRAIATRLMNDLNKEFESQKTALERPLQLRQWVHEHGSSVRPDRVRHGHVPFLGGLPENKSEALSFLLDSGFDRKQKYVQELAWELQKQRCDILRTKLNIKVGRSAYIFMVVDFWGLLKEDEVHVGFSSKFQGESDDESFTLLDGLDVLVARSPAHFPSDIQKVKAVFKPELRALKDVIVFPTKGDVPLADKLSGGDYDGDLAWVCWDPDIVENFANADVPEQPELSEYLGKDVTTFKELVRHTGTSGRQARYEAVYDMINRSFQFAMQPNYLGICTNYKERACYHANSVSNPQAILLSSLVGRLVDQSKQGIIFDATSWDRLRRNHFHGKMFFEDPAYKGDNWNGSGKPHHIIDYLKFHIAKPAIDRELEALHTAMTASKKDPSSAGTEEDAAPSWDPDLAAYYENFNSLARESRSLRAVLDALQNAIGEVDYKWKKLMSSKNGGSSSSGPALTYPEKVKQLHAQWCAIEPRAVGRAGSNRLDAKTANLLEQPHLAGRAGGGVSYWALLRASTAFKLHYNKNSRFVWQMAGAQLAHIKAMMLRGEGEGVSLLVAPQMYAGLMPDGKFVKQYVARLEGDGVGAEYGLGDSQQLENGEDGGYGGGEGARWDDDD